MPFIGVKKPFIGVNRVSVGVNMVSTNIDMISTNVNLASTNANMASTDVNMASTDVNKREFDEFRIMQAVCQKTEGRVFLISFSVCNFWKLQLMPDYARINAYLCSN